MSAVWLNTGIDYAAKVFLGKTARAELTTRLYTNNVDPAVTNVAADFTECTVTGYAAVSHVPADWTGSTVAGLATYVHTTITFTFGANGGGIVVYGYFTTVPGLIGVLAEKSAAPYNVPAAGGSLTIDVTYLDQKF